MGEHISPAHRAVVAARQRRKVRWLWFVVCETVVLAVMILTVIAGISERFIAESLTPVFRVVPITSRNRGNSADLVLWESQALSLEAI